ncbi:hypothetical protein GCM10027347_16060 [Larkinella harenae]
MSTPTQARIYLAEHRGCTQLSDYRSFHTLNVGSYQQEGREPFGALTVFDDDTLLAGKSHHLVVDAPTELVLLPVVGGLELVDSLGESVFLGAGEVFRFTAFPGQEYRVINPYQNEMVNFLHIGLTIGQMGAVCPENFPMSCFDIEIRNRLIPLFSSIYQNVTGYIGKYGGRQAGSYTLSNPQNSIFVFVIEGAFEVQNRLLHPRDSLALSNADTVEFEALSTDAILLVIEL